MKFTLMNILLKVDDFLVEHADMFYRSKGNVRKQIDGSLCFTGEVDFLTYFNALPLAKWRTYTSVKNVQLELCVQGDVQLQLCSVYAGDPMKVGSSAVSVVPVDLAACEQLASLGEVHGEEKLYSIDIPLDDALLVGFAAISPDGATIKHARYVTQVEQGAINPVRLAIATTTFHNEDYIVPNMQAIQREVLGCSEPISQALHMFVVDNGQTLDAATLNRAGIAVGPPDRLGRMQAPGITVCPNPNVGGSGGFARGMMEALGWVDSCEQIGRNELDVQEQDLRPYSHVLLMDDDVRVSPESIKRTFNVLCLANDQYKNAFVNGAMLKLQEPNIQFEDVSYARATGGYERFKPTLDVSRLDDVLRNETISVEGAGAYGAWWYSCIPVSAIREYGLPLPFFVRGDDVEYGLRCQGTYMAMSGICVWHEHFVGRFRASVDCYQYVRNLLAMSAIHDQVNMHAFMLRYWRVFHIFLRTMNYDAAELWLDGLEDYLRGPDWLAQADGAATMKANSAKNEKLVPLDQLDQNVLAQVDISNAQLGFDEPERSVLSKLLESVPHDRHWFPDALLSPVPGVIDYSGNLGRWQDIAMRKTLVAFDATGEHGHIRMLDRQRFRQLTERYRALTARFRSEGERVLQSWQQAFPYLVSPEFWREYLGLSNMGAN